MQRLCLLWVSREVAALAVVKVVDGQRTVHDFTGHHWHHGAAAAHGPEGDESSGKQRHRAQDHPTHSCDSNPASDNSAILLGSAVLLVYEYDIFILE